MITFLSSALKIIAQLCVFIAIWLIAGFIHRQFLPFIPQGFLGMMFLFVMLLSRLIPLELIEDGSRFFISHMLLFFVPAVVKLVEYKSLLLSHGVGIMVTVLLGSVWVMFSVGFVVDKIYAFELRKKQEKSGESECL